MELNNNIHLDCLTVGLVVAFTDDGWRANLHSLQSVYDLILFCFQVCFLCFDISALVFQWLLDLVSFVYPSAWYTLGNTINFIWDLSALFLWNTSCTPYIPASSILILGPLCPYVSILGPLCPSIFPMLGPNVPICTILSDSALQFRPWLSHNAMLDYIVLDLLYSYLYSVLIGIIIASSLLSSRMSSTYTKTTKSRSAW